MGTIRTIRYRRTIEALLAMVALLHAAPAHAINILINYQYDTLQFFNPPERRAAIEAAAARFSTIITTSLTAVTVSDDANDARVGFRHPASGLNYSVSAASSALTDVMAPSQGLANEYRGAWSIPANQFIIYAGARPMNDLVAIAEGGTANASNSSATYLNSNSILNRGFRASGSSSNLPMWGGSLAFDSDGTTQWHFDLETPSPSGKVDFYSHALHEIGHVLGLSFPWNEWNSKVTAGAFTGLQARTAYNADNGTALTGLLQESATDRHFKNNMYDSFIFQNGNPRYAGTVGAWALQDVLMEYPMDYTPQIRRFELTNVDVGALRDLGWSTVSTVHGDYNGDGSFNAADYVIWKERICTTNTYNLWRSSFAASGAAPTMEATEVPEPSACGLALLAALALGNRSPRRHWS